MLISQQNLMQFCSRCIFHNTLFYSLIMERSYLLSDMHITPFMVSAIISKLNPHKTCKPYGIPDIFLRICCRLSPVFSKLYNKYFLLLAFM